MPFINDSMLLSCTIMGETSQFISSQLKVQPISKYILMVIADCQTPNVVGSAERVPFNDDRPTLLNGLLRWFHVAPKNGRREKMITVSASWSCILFIPNEGKCILDGLSPRIFFQRFIKWCSRIISGSSQDLLVDLDHEYIWADGGTQGLRNEIKLILL